MVITINGLIATKGKATEDAAATRAGKPCNGAASALTLAFSHLLVNGYGIDK